MQRLHESLKAAIDAKLRERLLLLELHSGHRADPLALAQADKDISHLREQWAAEPLRNLSRAVLDDAQNAKLASFERDLEVVREAIELQLIPNPPKVEPLCM